ncbi:hypothetical protein OG21DRAFT_1509140 [Imleria badia]|nr:hypothetical protein OG21DRAFT_1509140 [Imleria badia]
MLRLNYFDDVVGQVEGFQIFADLMQHDDLRDKVINRYRIAEVLYTNLGSGEPRNIRTSLVCLRIFRSHNPDDPWTCKLVDESLKHLLNPAWEVQKAAVTVLAALAGTKHGVKVIVARIHKIVEMLLPKGYLLIPPSPLRATPASPASPSEGHMQPVLATTSQITVAPSPTSPDAPPMPPSWMLGPACALRILAQDKKLRDHMRDTIQYESLKHLYLSGTLLDETDTPPWQVKTPNRADVTNMLDKIIKVVDEELSEEGRVSTGDMLPHIEHWDRLVMLLPDQAITILPAQMSRFFKWLRPHDQDSILDGL